MHVQFRTDGDRKVLAPYWNFCVGSCHATTALREDYRKQLTLCRQELGFRYVRFHGILDDDMSVITQKKIRGKVEEQYVLSFTNIDSIFDFLLSIGMKPFLEIGFMPGCLRTKDTTVFHYKGYTSKPSDYRVWDYLMESLARHLVERYGRDEVRQWFFEVWNEPNLGGEDQETGFWTASMEEYFHLYQHTAMALKTVDPMLQVGGPATSNNAWIPEFVSFCKDKAVPVDFISTHHYPTDVILGYGVEDSQNFLQLREGETQEAYDARKEEWFKHLWEKVDRGVLTDMTRKAVAEAKGLPVYYTEWNSLAGLPSDGPFGASFIMKTILDSTDLVKGYSYWTFSDIFEEGGMPSAAFHGGFGLLTLQGIPKATYRAFQLLQKLGEEMYVDICKEGTVDVYGFYKAGSASIQLVLVNHHSLLHPIQDETVNLTLEGLGLEDILEAEVSRIDQKHGNALARWEEIGRPEYLKPAQLESIMGASYVEPERLKFSQTRGKAMLELVVPGQGIAMVQIYLKQQI